MNTTTITLRIKPESATNLLGVAGLAAIVVAIGGLAGVWWAVLAAGLFVVGLVTLVQHAAAGAADEAIGDKRAADVLHMPPPARGGAATVRNGASA